MLFGPTSFIAHKSVQSSAKGSRRLLMTIRRRSSEHARSTTFINTTSLSTEHRFLTWNYSIEYLAFLQTKQNAHSLYNLCLSSCRSPLHEVVVCMWVVGGRWSKHVGSTTFINTTIFLWNGIFAPMQLFPCCTPLSPRVLETTLWYSFVRMRVGVWWKLHFVLRYNPTPLPPLTQRAPAPELEKRPRINDPLLAN